MKIGFIGAGNMAGALIKGIIGGGVRSSDIKATDINEAHLKTVADFADTSSDNLFVTDCQIIFLAVKPQTYDEVIEQISDVLKSGTILVSLAPNFSIEELFFKFNRRDIKIVRAMPNMPAVVSAGMTALAFGENCEKDDIEKIKNLFCSVGEVSELKEKDFHAFIGIAGSAPAYLFMLMEALTDTGIKYGLNPEAAVKFSAQTVIGSGLMVKETGYHPALLKQQVCSPGGTTIEAVLQLEKLGFKGTIISAIEACVEKSKKMSTKEIQ